MAVNYSGNLTPWFEAGFSGQVIDPKGDHKLTEDIQAALKEMHSVLMKTKSKVGVRWVKVVRRYPLNLSISPF